MAGEDRIVFVCRDSECRRNRARRCAVHVRVLLISITDLQELRGRQIEAGLTGDQFIGEGSGERLAVELRIYALGVNDIVCVPLRLLVGTEEVCTVANDRPAEGAAVLIAAVVALRSVVVSLDLRLLVETFGAVE